MARAKQALAALAALLPGCSHAQPSFDKIVWAHQMGVMPNSADLQYGSTYPILLFNQNDPADRAAFPQRRIADAIQSGLNGIAFEVTPGHNSRAPGVPQYEAVIKAFAGSGIPIAPCIDVEKDPGAPADIIEAIEGAYAAAKAHANPALMPDGRLITFLYASNHQPPETWAAIRAQLTADGYKILLMGDAGQANIPPAQFLTNAARVSAAWDGAYNFPGVGMGGTVNANSQFSKTMAAHGRAWVGSVMPSYYRGVNVSATWGPFGVDALGTARLRSTWQDILASDIRWVYWVTQNDFVEHTNLMADSSWGYTRADMNLWFARKFTQKPYPYAPALYLTTPQALRASETSVVELAIINPRGSPLSAMVQLVADNGAVLGSAQLKAAGGQLSAVQIPISGAISARYSSVRAIAKGASGTITSPPVLLSKLAKLPGDHGVVNYYSTNSRLTPPPSWRPIIAAHGDSITLSGIDPSTIMAADLLGDGNLIDQIKFPPTGPITLSASRILNFDRDSNDNKNSRLYAEPTRYLLRIVLKSGAIWYSAPLTLP